MLNQIRIGPKLALMVLVPLLAALLLGAIVWHGASKEIADARGDRAIAETAAAVSTLPAQILAETSSYGIGGRMSDDAPARQLLIGQLRSANDDAIARFRRAPSQEALPSGVWQSLDDEIAALADTRRQAEAGTLTKAEIDATSGRLLILGRLTTGWIVEQDVHDPRGSWRLLTVTGAGSELLVTRAPRTFEVLIRGTASAQEIEFLRAGLTGLQTAGSLEEALLPPGLSFTVERQRETQRLLREVSQRAIALEGRTPPAPVRGAELLRDFRNGAAVANAYQDRKAALTDDVVAAADARIAQAGRAQLVVATAVLATMILALATALILARNILSRIGRVSEQAHELNEGIIRTDRQPVDGSDEIAVLGLAMDRVSALYSRLVAQTEAIASGRLNDASLRDPLPGTLGRALQRSVDRVARNSAELLKLATHDELTGLLDRGGLARGIEAFAGQPGRGMATVFFIDLDGFKEINDRLGHSVGDRVLKEAARRLREVAREHDIVARLGGDEFVVLAHDVEDESTAERIAQRMVAVLNAPLSLDDGEVTVTASLGWATAELGVPIAQLIDAADAAMYSVKGAGGGGVRRAESVVSGPRLTPELAGTPPVS